MVSLREFIQEQEQQQPTDSRIIPRESHCISRKNISANALKVLYGLKDAGYPAYLVGGGVRDLLLGREPKDFDLATGAKPEEVRRLFRNARLIGRRFILVHVYFGEEIIEVATFRGNSQAAADNRETDEKGRILSDNVYGTLEEDIYRRDFTINALYYNIEDFSLVDHTKGMQDLEHGVVRLIGDPETRYREDPVRMLRAIRFAAKLGFRLEEQTQLPIGKLAPLLLNVPAARLFEETNKLFLSGHAIESFELLRHYDLFHYLFPTTEDALQGEEEHFPRTFLPKVLENTDQRYQSGLPIAPPFLFAALLWEPVKLLQKELEEEGLPPAIAIQKAGNRVLIEQAKHVAIPKKFAIAVREIWDMQYRFDRRSGRRAYALAAHPRFKASFDFLKIRTECGEIDGELVEWWEKFMEADNQERKTLVQEVKKDASGPLPPMRRRRRRPRKKNTAE